MTKPKSVLKEVMIRIPVEVANKIEEEAEKEGLTLSTKIRTIVMKYHNRTNRVSLRRADEKV